MKYKYIAKVGAFLISFLVLLSGLMYYFSQAAKERTIANISEDDAYMTVVSLFKNSTTTLFENYGMHQCPRGTFPCENSTVCVSQLAWCDSIPDCPYGDDETECFDASGSWSFFLKNRSTSESEMSCENFECPRGCACGESKCQVVCGAVGYTEIPSNLSLQNNLVSSIPKNILESYGELRSLFMDGNRISLIEPGAFEHQTKLVWLTLSNNGLSELRKGQFIGLDSLELLLVEDNQIEYADLTDFEYQTALEWIWLNNNRICSRCLKLPYLPRLKEIFLDGNKIDEISEDLFSGLPGLTGLSLENNQIRTIHENAFRNSINLVELNLAGNEIVTLPRNLFLPMGKLQKLRLNHNPIENLTIDVLQPLQELRSLNVEEIEIDNMEKNAFALLRNLNFAYFKKFHYCTTYAPNVQVCRPKTDGVSSLSHLLGKPLLRAAVWGISCVTCLGNALVLWGRLTARDENRVLSIMIRNLAVSDLLMGVYLLIIAIKDLEFRNNYNLMANDWTSSWSCTFVGALAMTSSEVSVLILAFMSVERFMLIASPLKTHRPLTARNTYSSMIVIWVVGIIIAIIPAIHWRSSTRFYGVNGLCFPLHIDNPFLVGWEYSAFIFLGLNLLGLFIIGYVYSGMFASIWKTRHATPLAVGDSEFALRFFLIVLTDAACWVPIIILKIVAMTKYPVPPDLHAWVVIFILPVNSAVNPLLYTFTTPKFRERLNEGWFGTIRNIVSRRQSGQDSQVSRASSNKNMVLALSAENNKDTIGIPGLRYLTPFDNNKFIKPSNNHISQQNEEKISQANFINVPDRI